MTCPTSKRFSGKRYTLITTTATKRRATSEAKRLRGRKLAARVSPVKKLGKKYYGVYAR